MSNARLSERAPFFAEVDVVAAGIPAPRRVWGTDVSESGMFLQTTQPFRVGDRLSLRFDVDKDEVHVRAAEVMWVRPFEPINVDGKQPGIGLKFVAIDPNARAALRKLIAPTVSDTQPETAAISLAPFSQPPLDISLPEDEPFCLPDEVRVFKQTRPSPVTIGPKSAPPTMLIGWTFKRDEPEAPKLDLRFDDSPPHGVHAPTAQPVMDVTSTPPEAVMRDGGILSPPALDKEILEGTVAIKHLPIGEERKPKPAPKKKSRTLETAIGLLVAGCVLGSGIGYVTKRWQKHEARLAHATSHHAQTTPETTTTTSSSIYAAPASSMPGWSASATMPPPAVPSSSSAAPRATPESATLAPSVAEAPASTSPPKAVKSVIDAEGELSVKPDPVADSTLTDAAPLPRKHHKGHTATVKVGDAEVARVFSLENPNRIVVDLNGGHVPKGTLEPGGGVGRIRFGHPAKGKTRVVVELEGDKAPKDLAADVDAGLLQITFH